MTRHTHDGHPWDRQASATSSLRFLFRAERDWQIVAFLDQQVHVSIGFAVASLRERLKGSSHRVHDRLSRIIAEFGTNDFREQHGQGGETQ